ncbi:MAG: hypothetical protein QN135_07970 [Armatimonadota bacterium]|nr:hypothetical protein [Armatimonadota bacterium]
MNATVRRLLRDARLRLAWRRAVGAAALAAVLALSVGLGAQLLTLLMPFEVSAWWVLGGAAAAAALALGAGRLVLVPSVSRAAFVLDRRCGLDDRLTTWLAVESGQAKTALRDYLEEDTLRAAARVRVRDAIALRPPVAGRRILALVAAVVVWEFLLAGTTLPYTPARRTAEAIRQEGRALEDTAHRMVVTARARQLRRLGEAASRTEEVGRALQTERIGRGGALGRLQRLAEHIEQARQQARTQIQQRMGAPSSPQPDRTSPPPVPNAEAVEAQAKQLRELAEQLEEITPSPQELARIRQALRSVYEQSRGNASVQTRRHLDEAHQRLRRHDTAGARRAIQQAEEDLRDLQRLLEEEGLLQQAGERVRRSHQRVAEAPRGGVGEQAVGRGEGDSKGVGPGDERLDGGTGEVGEDPAPEGPRQGRRAGSGQAPANTGPPTERLAGERRREALAGQQGGGPTFGAEVEAEARRTQVRTQTVAISPRILRQADETMHSARVPGSYREIVRRYFLHLARQGR